MFRTLCWIVCLCVMTIGCAGLARGAPPAAEGSAVEGVAAPSNIAVAAAAVEARVLRVVDGDTIEVDLQGRNYKIRYIGIDTPETVDPDKPVQPFGPEASAKNKELVQGKTVRLEKDVSETDRYGRLLRYVYVGDMMVNAELVRLGYAQVATYPPDVKYAAVFLRQQREAREAGRGLWAQTPTTTPARSTTVPRQSPPAGDLTIQVVSVTSPVKRGTDARVEVLTAPGASCAITVHYAAGPSDAAGLEPKTADESGRVSWVWTIGSRTTPGTWKIVVTAGKDGEQGSVISAFTVE